LRARRLNSSRDLLAAYFVSSTSVSGRSLPAAVSVCQWPFSSSYSITSVCPGTRCSAAAMRAAASAAAWVGHGSENAPLTVYAQPSSWRTIRYVTCDMVAPLMGRLAISEVAQPDPPLIAPTRRVIAPTHPRLTRYPDQPAK